MNNNNQLHLMLISTKDNEIVTRCDFGLTIEYEMNINQLSCTIDASLDLFNVITTEKMTQQFHSLLKQLFSPMNDQMNKSIYELSLILSDERLLMKSMNNTEIFVPSLSCIHHEFVSQVMKYPQKLAVELDDQSLTYCELLYYVQMLSLNLLNRYEIIPGEIICQCVERSLSMVS
jgi:non-ribosomal peptide synthetase component F